MRLTFHSLNTLKETILKDYTRLKFSIVIVLLLLQISAFAQIGGKGVYTFLGMPNASRVAAVGGNYLPVNDGDINLAVSNPSLINAEMHNKIGLAFVDFYSDISAGFASYSRTYDKIGSFTG